MGYYDEGHYVETEEDREDQRQYIIRRANREMLSCLDEAKELAINLRDEKYENADFILTQINVLRKLVLS